MSRLDIAEIPFESGSIQFRYARKLSEDGTRWIRDGLFRAYYENGILASEGNYSDGLENGLWRDYHVNGQIAAEGSYISGVEAVDWRYWDHDGTILLLRQST
jgi:antitoxin component YwqK of YwqJK toxin-antitoxin module